MPLVPWTRTVTDSGFTITNMPDLMPPLGDPSLIEKAKRELQSTEINLLRGWPSKDLLPTGMIKTAADKALLQDSKEALLYGPDLGYEPLRVELAKWLTQFYQRMITSDRICITGGASQNLGCMLNVYTDPEFTRNIWIVVPAYFLAFRIFEDAGFAGKMRAVPEDDEGADIEFLRREISKSEDQAQKNGNDKPKYKPDRARAKVYKHIIYCVPTFANPSSKTTTLARRIELVKLAREFDALIVCDDVYDTLQWDIKGKTLAEKDELQKIYVAPLYTRAGFPVDFTGKLWPESKRLMVTHLPRVVDVDRGLAGGAEREGADGFGNACSNGSFSKIAGPGIRVGWVEGTEKFAYGVSQTGTTCSGGAPSQLASTFMFHCLQGSLDHHIRIELRPGYASRYQTLMKGIETHLLPLDFQLPQTYGDVVGGFFTWLSTPEGVNAGVLAHRCEKEQKLIIAPGKIFEVPGDDTIKFDRSIRLCWAWEHERLFEEGMRRIAVVAKKMLDEGENGAVLVVGEGKDAAARFK